MGDAADSRAVVGVEHAWKRFRTPQQAAHTLKERVLHPMRHRAFDEFLALKDVSFDVQRGAFYGIVGRNGSGKSTLLKCLAGIYRLDGGRIVIDGQMSTFIELGVGFNPDLAAEDNVVMNGIMLGLTAKEARRRFDEIIDFAELREHTELKLKNYSSGMHVRLAFAVAIQVRADILLIDEVLAVGDAAFQQKCFDVFREMRDEGRTVLFVTHDMGAVTRMCDRALLLEHGQVVTVGDPDAVATRYLQLNFDRDHGALAGVELAQPRPERRLARIAGSRVLDEDGTPTSTCMQHRRYRYEADVEFLRDVRSPAFTLVFRDEDHRDVLVATTAFSGPAEDYTSGRVARIAVTFENVFRPGRYDCSVIVAEQEFIERHDDALTYVVAGPYATGGLVDVHHDMSVSAVAAPLSAEAP